MCLEQKVQLLREQQMKDKSQIVKLNDKLDAFEGKKRFDPAKAFQPQTKENDHPPQHLQLHDGNTHLSAHLLYTLVVLLTSVI